MSITYYGAHSITFIRKRDHAIRNSWRDFHLVPSKKPVVTVPEVASVMIQLPRSSKVIDATNILSNKRLFGLSEGEWEFIIDDSKWEHWAYALDAADMYFDGTEFELFLNDAPSIIYDGVLKISNYSPGQENSSITIAYTLGGYKDLNNGG